MLRVRIWWIVRIISNNSDNNLVYKSSKNYSNDNDMNMVDNMIVIVMLGIIKKNMVVNSSNVL